MTESGALSQNQSDIFKSSMASLNGLSSQDLLMFIAAALLRQLNSNTSLPIFISSNYTASNGDVVMANTSAGAFSVTLPLNPEIGERVDIYDAQSSFATNNLTINRNGQFMNGAAGNVVANINNVHIALVFNGGSQGWSLYNG